MKEKRDEIIILRTTKAEKNRIYEKMLGMGIRSLSAYISQEAWKQYLALDEICNELECARYKAMYLTGAADYEKISK